MAERRVFLSHSGKDKEFVKELYRRLTRDGVSCFFDIESIGWGDNWVRALELGLDECEFVVFVLSPDFCNSEWVEVERSSNMADDPRGQLRKVRPLTLQPCRQLPTFPRFLRQVQSLDVSTPELFEKNYPRICRELGGIPGDDEARLDRTTLPPAGPLPQRNSMLFQPMGDNFVGRVEEMWNLHDALFHNGTVVVQGTGVVVGTGGLGKTQLAIEYAYRFGFAYAGGVYWVDAERGLTTMISQVATAAGVEIDNRAAEQEQLRQLWQGLNQLSGPSLLILDNFPENTSLRPYLPAGARVHTLVTTRRKDLDYPSVVVRRLSSDEAIRLLNTGARKFGAEVAPLVELLDGLPLALELAKSYLNYRRTLTIAGLLEERKAAGEIELVREFASQYRDELPSRHGLDIARTFQMSWDVAPEMGRLVLRAMGELAPAAVPVPLLRSVLEVPVVAGVWDELGQALDELARLSLVELDGSGNPVAHRLVLAFARYRNVADNESPFEQCSAAARSQMDRAGLTMDAATMRELELIVPHAEFLLAGDRLRPEDFSLLADRVGAQHRVLGRYLDAKRLRTAALHADEKTYAAGHPAIARGQSNLALVLSDLGEFEEARDLLRQALASDEKTYVAGHPTIAVRQSNLATVLRDLGELEEARDLLRQALASDQKTYAAGHPSIARSQSNLAVVLRDLREFQEARDLLRQALASDEKRTPPGTPPSP